MDPIRIGEFIKEIRKKNNLTQKEFAKKYNVTYQAVSKWERGLNLPDLTLIREMSKNFNIELSDILDGNIKNKEKSKKKYLIIFLIILFIVILLLIIINNHNNSFDFKTISSTCSDFSVSGSIAYDSKRSSIYISNINYCGGVDNNIYQEIECSLFEVNNDTNVKISSCSKKENITLEDYLKDISLNIDNYQKKCKNYTDDSLYLEINTLKDESFKTYKIPLSLDKNCKN